MWRVKLETRDGEFVTHVLLPPFVQMPELVLWGARWFQLCDSGVYRECFAVVAYTERDSLASGLDPRAVIRDYPR